MHPENKAIADKLRRLADRIERGREPRKLKALLMGGDLRYRASFRLSDDPGTVINDGAHYTPVCHAIFIGDESFVRRATFVEEEPKCILQPKNSTTR